jgi:hypothetical protein
MPKRITKSGKRIEVSLTVSPIKDAGGQVIGASKIIRDITERKSMEDALRTSEKYAAMGRVAAVLAHEISNPLAAVTNAFYLLQKHPSLDEEGRELARIAHAELARVSHITKQTLGLYRHAERPTRLSLSVLLDEILDVYTRQFQKLEIVLERRFTVQREVLAIQAMPNGGRLRGHLHEAASRTHSGPRTGCASTCLIRGSVFVPNIGKRCFNRSLRRNQRKGRDSDLGSAEALLKSWKARLKYAVSLRITKM